MNLFAPSLNPKRLSRHTVLKHFIETADMNCICHYYDDPYFKNIPNAVLLDYIDELVKDGYVKHYIRHVVLTAKAYSYLSERRDARIREIILHLTRPVSYLLAWVLGMLSTVIAEILIWQIFH